MPAEQESPISASEAKSLFSDLENVPALLLAVSGGPDSIALMVLAARWRKALKSPLRKPDLIVATVDHGLRSESKREAADVAKLAGTLGLTHRTLRWSGTKPKTGLPQAARLARYALLAGAARKAGAAHVLTAHTLDDQAETVLIRMSRGSGLTGLAAMQRISVIPGRREAASPESILTDRGHGSRARAHSASQTRVNALIGASRNDEVFLVRPLLDVPKARLIATLRAEKIPFVDDPSNRDPRFTRARLRGLMPQLAKEGLDGRRLALLARRLKRADGAIETAVDRAHTELTADLGAPGVYDASGFARLPAEIALRLLGRAIGTLGDEGPVELGKLEALKEALDAAQMSGSKRFRRSLAGALVTLAKGKITVERAPPRQKASRAMSLTKRRRAAGKGRATPAKSR
jgi:tRNA(Ile)-lysidine synthase